MLPYSHVSQATLFRDITLSGAGGLDALGSTFSWRLPLVYRCNMYVCTEGFGLCNSGTTVSKELEL